MSAHSIGQPLNTSQPSSTLSGTLTFLFTDIEGSTRLLQGLGSRYAEVLAAHDALMERAVTGRSGRVFGHEGDAVFAVFGESGHAIAAALDAQRAIRAHEWPDGTRLRVRMGIHAGDAIPTGTSYVGLPLHQVARICSAAHGGQVLVSESARALAASALDPGVELRDVGEHQLKDMVRAERLFELVADGHPPHPEPLRTTSRRPGNLPLQLTSFVGRAEIAEARRLLAASRLLTLTGPGGTGKTRLSLELAAEVVDEFPDGVWFVALDAVDDAELVPSAIAHVIGVELGAEPPLERLVAHLVGQRTLLVLDNFEQVAAAATGISRLVREAPDVRLLVTSRVVLRVHGEQEFRVPPLSLPGDGSITARDAAESEAVRLFVERAQAAQSTFRLDDRNAPAVADLVTRLDGLPLAIELAAARVRVLPVEALRARLDQRLSLLTGGARDLPARQQTLRGAIDWSYDLLEAPDRRLFERFAVFSGGASLGEIESVCGPAAEIGQDVLDGLASLVEKSLLRSVETSQPDPRFAMLATIREYAAERLAERDDASVVRARHAATYLAAAEQCAPNLTRGDAAANLDRLEQDHDNLRAALDWSLEAGEVETAYRFGSALWRFWQMRGHLHEATDRVARILAAPGGDALPPVVRARMLLAAGSVAYWAGDAASTGVHYLAALEAARLSADLPLLAEATYNAGFQGDALGARGQRYAAGRARFEEAIGLYEQIGDGSGVANATWALAIAELAAGETVAARAHFEDSLARYRRLGEAFGEGWALRMLGLIDLLENQPEDADARFRAALEIFQRSSDLSALALLLQDFSMVAQLRGEVATHLKLGGASDALAKKTGTGLAGNTPDFINLDLPARPTGDPEGERCWDEGLALTTQQALELALGHRAANDPAGGNA